MGFQDAALPYKASSADAIAHDGLRSDGSRRLPLPRVRGEIGSGESFPGNDRNTEWCGSCALRPRRPRIGASYAGAPGFRTSERPRAPCVRDVDALAIR